MRSHPYLLAAACALLCSVAPLRAQRIFVGADFATRFDNREYAGTAFADASETLFGARLAPTLGVRWDERNTLAIGVDLRQDFGDDAKFLTEAKPLIYYAYETPRVFAAAGIFPRERLCGAYGELFFDDAYLFYNNRIQGLAGRYRAKGGGFVELAIDWEGMRSKRVREKFRLLSAGEWSGKRFYGGYALSLLHFAKTSDPAPGEGVVDYLLINPYGGLRFSALFDFDIRFGYVQSFQRDRIAENGWKAPKGGMLDVRIGYKGLSLGNTLYAGECQMPFFDRYGTALYAGSVFFATRNCIYNRTDISYGRRFFGDTVGVRAGFLFHCAGKGLGTQQRIEVDVRLQKIFDRRHRKAENR